MAVPKGEFVVNALACKQNMLAEDLTLSCEALDPNLVLAQSEVLAALGLGSVEVFREPRVAIISTGDELVDVGRMPRLIRASMEVSRT